LKYDDFVIKNQVKSVNCFLLIVYAVISVLIDEPIAFLTESLGEKRFGK